MRWLAVAAAGVLAMIGILLVRNRRHDDVSSVGPVSEEWIAQHRAGAPDSLR